MTERFVVPEPSDDAIERGHEDIGYLLMDRAYDDYRRSVAGAFAVDLPHIVKAEVERALKAAEIDAGSPLLSGYSRTVIHDYLAARFGPSAETGQPERVDGRPPVSPS